MTQPTLFDRPVVNTLRDQALQRVGQHAEDHRPGFAEQARAFVLAYLHTHGPTSGEQLTLQCKQAGIKAHDDRAMGAVFMTLARAGRIVKVGTARRERGHGTAGGNVWALAAQKNLASTAE